MTRADTGYRKDIIRMAREAGFFIDGVQEFVFARSSFHFTDELTAFAALVRADERKSRAHSLGPGEMELSLRRNHKDEFFECLRRFSAEEVMHGPDFMVEATASNLEVEMNRVIQKWSNNDH